MKCRFAVSVVLEAHLPFIKEYSKDSTAEECCLFETISETLLPLLETMERLENDHVPFRLALVISPVLFQMLLDEELQNKYLNYIDKQIEFGRQEMDRLVNDPETHKLAESYYTKIIDRRFNYTEKYEKNLNNAFDFYKRRGKLEILATSATNTFFPFIAHNCESIQAQIETPVSFYRKHFRSLPHGFWLPFLGWTPAAEPYLHAYNYNYTIIDSHGFLFGSPAPLNGTFCPARTQYGTYVFGRDYYITREIEKIAACEVYRNNNLDAGYELEKEKVKMFLNDGGERQKTGFKYWAKNTGVYNQKAASEKVHEHARMFLENTIARLEEACNLMDQVPVCLYANNADSFGSLWHEGQQFIEAIFRMASHYRDFQFINPSEYLLKQDVSLMQTVNPEFSSYGINGYAESWINNTNDKLFRHLFHSMERMTELAERFPDDTGLKERVLNQAAREMLLAQSLDSLNLYSHHQIENALRNFTTIYEALGSNYISTEWLTTLEKNHNLFADINYRVFRRKK